MRKSRLLFALCIIFVPGAILGQDDPPVIRGTINVILANGNGIVALTDSQQTEMTPTGPRPYPEPGQKLFRLDDQTVCTIAGFGSAALPTLPRFTSSASGIIQEYTRRPHPASTFLQKLRTLAYLFEFHLRVIANFRDAASDPGLYHFELIMAGYDLDGTPKLGRVMLNVSLERAGVGGYVFSPAIETVEERPVGRNLAYEIGGQPGVALSILRNPGRWSRDPMLRQFARAYRTEKGASLTLDQMKQLAVALARHTAENNPTVGGNDQIAALKNGRIVGFQQQSFPPQPEGLRVALVEGMVLNGEAIVFKDSGVPIFINVQFRNQLRVLDDSLFLKSEFVNSRLRYDGGFTGFDLSNRVEDCVLIIGPRAARGSEAVRHLADDFVWRQVIFERP